MKGNDARRCVVYFLRIFVSNSVACDSVAIFMSNSVACDSGLV